MKTVLIDFTDVKHFQQIHDVIAMAFGCEDIGFPDFYGRNADALWDCLTGFIETPASIVIKGSGDIKKDFRPYIDIILKVFLDATKLDWIDIYVEIVS